MGIVLTRGRRIALAVITALLINGGPAFAGQTATNVEGVVLDPSGGFVPDASVELRNEVSRYSQKTHSDANGKFKFTNVPMDPYHLVVKASGFAETSQDVEVKSLVGASIEVHLTVAAKAESVTVEASGGALLETESAAHVDVGRELIEKLDTEGKSSRLSLGIPRS